MVHNLWEKKWAYNQKHLKLLSSDSVKPRVQTLNRQNFGDDFRETFMKGADFHMGHIIWA